MARTVTVRGDERALTAREFDLLLALARRPRAVLNRDTLLERVWGSADYIDPSTVTVHVRRVRAKIEDDPSPATPHHDSLGRGLPVRAVSAPQRRRAEASPLRLVVFVAGAVVAVAAGLLVFALVMRPPQNDFVAMAGFLGITAFISIGVGVAASRRDGCAARPGLPGRSWRATCSPESSRF